MFFFKPRFAPQGMGRAGRFLILSLLSCPGVFIPYLKIPGLRQLHGLYDYLTDYPYAPEHPRGDCPVHDSKNQTGTRILKQNQQDISARMNTVSPPHVLSRALFSAVSSATLLPVRAG
jgi:hypothetical protein